jgi:hypothetical protein
MPKRGFPYVAKSNDGGGIEDFHILLVAWAPILDPNLVGILPLQPSPTKSKCRGKFSHVRNSKASKLLRTVY